MGKAFLLVTVYVLISALLICHEALCQTTPLCKKPTTLPPNSHFVSSPNCSGAYNTGTEKCHCWGHCGYICQPLSSDGGGSTPVGTCKPENANGPAKLGSDQEWAALPGCPIGGVFQRPDPNPTQRCHCYAYCGYVCEPYISRK